MKNWEIVADELSATGWSWAIAAPLPDMAGAESLMPIAETVAATLSILTNC